MSPSDIRPGEVAVPLPEHFDAQLYFIGRIRTPWTRREDCPKNARESDAICRVEVDARWADALTAVETCSHLFVLYWMDRARRDLVLQESIQGSFRCMRHEMANARINAHGVVVHAPRHAAAPISGAQRD